MSAVAPGFADVDDFIRTITDRIWEGRRFDDLRRHYAPDVVVETPTGTTVGVEPVIAATRATLAEFPDRRLLAEDVILSGDAAAGVLSSHRILSPMTHAADGAFGRATGRPVVVRTVADCVVRDGRIVHEWLVRDQSAIAAQLGLGAEAVARARLRAHGPFESPATTVAPAPYRPTLDDAPAARAWSEAWATLWSVGDPRALEASHARDAIVALPGGTAAVGHAAIARAWSDVLAALRDARWTLEQRALLERPGRAGALAMRWRVTARHAGGTRYGPPTDRPISLLGITHAEIEDGRVVREWVLIDEIAIWMQVLTPRR
jgi:predicted ester cyclase